MAVERMTIIEITPGYLSVSARDAGHCVRCAVKNACGRHLFEDLLQRRTPALRIAQPQAQGWGRQPGDSVDVSLDDADITRISFLLYLPPLFCLMLATALADRFVSASGANETWVILAALVALTTGFRVVKWLSAKSAVAGRVALEYEWQPNR